MSVCFFTASRDVAAAQVVRNRGLELISGLGHSLEVKQTVCGLDAAGTGGNVSLAGTGHRCKTQEVILGNHRPFRAVRMSNVDLLNWVEQPKNPSLLDPSKIIVKADKLTVEPGA